MISQLDFLIFVVSEIVYMMSFCIDMFRGFTPFNWDMMGFDLIHLNSR